MLHTGGIILLDRLDHRPPVAAWTLAPCGFIPYTALHQWSIVLLGTATAWSRHGALDTVTMLNLSLVNRYSFTDIYRLIVIPCPIRSLLYSLLIQLHISALHEFIIHFTFGRIHHCILGPNDVSKKILAQMLIAFCWHVLWCMACLPESVYHISCLDWVYTAVVVQPAKWCKPWVTDSNALQEVYEVVVTCYYWIIIATRNVCCLYYEWRLSMGIFGTWPGVV